jgi:vacuolar-type H+-ATPase subunit I/STV1
MAIGFHLDDWERESLSDSHDVYELNKQIRNLKKQLETVRSEAIREFAERLKNKFYSYYEGLDENTSKSKYNGETLMYYEVADMIENCIDNTVKELTEEQNEP